MELRLLTPNDENTFKAAIEEFKTHNPDWEFAFNLEDQENFSAFCALLLDQSQGRNLRGFVPNTYMGAFVNGKCVGRASIRHELNENLSAIGGHVGYGVVPSERGKGYAKEILRRSLDYLKARGLTRALVTCSDDNVPSIKTIESCGGALENKFSRPGSDTVTRRYWIDLG